MIFLDTNFLIHGLVTGTAEAAKITGWLDENELIAMASVAWYEFLCGPVSNEEIELATAVLTNGVIPFTEAEAAVSAKLFNAVNRSRGTAFSF